MPPHLTPHSGPQRVEGHVAQEFNKALALLVEYALEHGLLASGQGMRSMLFLDGGQGAIRYQIEWLSEPMLERLAQVNPLVARDNPKQLLLPQRMDDEKDWRRISTS